MTNPAREPFGGSRMHGSRYAATDFAVLRFSVAWRARWEFSAATQRLYMSSAGTTVADTRHENALRGAVVQVQYWG
jgi:hypothetical protein